jgi:hypothetical protein
MRTLVLKTLGLLAAVLALTGCGSGSSGGPAIPTTTQAARAWALTGFSPTGGITAGKTVPLSFTVTQPSGQPLTRYRTGSGPHTGVHVIIVRDDLSSIIHRHPKPGADGRVSLPVSFPTPGRYHVLVDVYPANVVDGLPNFQLTRDVVVPGKAVSKPLPPLRLTQVQDGVRFVLSKPPRLQAATAAFLEVRITDAKGKPAQLQPFYGALAHAIFFQKGTLAYFHTHICGASTPACAIGPGASAVSGGESSPGMYRVGVLTPVPGTWELFLQAKVDGKLHTVPYTLQVK